MVYVLNIASILHVVCWNSACPVCQQKIRKYSVVRESNSRHFGCYLAITPQQTSIIYFWGFFFLNVKQCYLCLMQKQLRNIFFAKKKTIFTRISMWKFLLIKHLYNNWWNILWGTVTAELWKCFLIWRLINTMLINKSHWSATSTQVKTSEKTTPHFLERTVTFVDFFCDCKAACWLNTIIMQSNVSIWQTPCFTWMF